MLIMTNQDPSDCICFSDLSYKFFSLKLHSDVSPLVTEVRILSLKLT
jgi:hypothetical protein